MVAWWQVYSASTKSKSCIQCASSLAPKKYLKKQELGVYTVVGVENGQMDDWNFHFRRLRQGWRDMYSFEINGLETECYKIAKELLNHAMATRIMTRQSRKGSLTILCSGTSWNALKIHFLLNHDGTSERQQHGNKLAAVITEIHREWPLVKYTQWVHDRAPFENPAMQDCVIGTVVGEGDDVQLLEGFVTNLFIVYSDHSIRTAVDSLVLNGFMRSKVIRLCRKNGYALSYKAILWSERCEWVGGFLTNAIRKVDTMEAIEYRGDRFKFPMISLAALMIESITSQL